MAASLLGAHEAVRERCAASHRRLLAIAREDEAAGRLMTVPGVGPVVAVTFKAAVEDPGRFARPRAVGAHFGLVPRKHRSGEVDRTGRITRSATRRCAPSCSRRPTSC